MQVQKRERKFIRSIIGNFLLQFYFVLITVHFYLYYIAIRDMNIGLIIYAVALMIVQFMVKGKNKYFILLIKWFRIMDMFDDHQIILEEEVAPHNTIIGFHPHGILAYGLLWNLNSDHPVFKDLVCLGSRLSIYAPLSGLFLKFWGVRGVDAAQLSKLLKNGNNVGLYPGGFEEATITSPHEDRVFIKSRKGFIKYGLKFGQTLHPAFAFGENQMFNTIDWFLPFRLWLNKFKLVGTIFFSRYGLFPNFHISHVTVIGKGIKLPKIDDPKNDDIEKYHKIYLEALQTLHDKYKDKYSNGRKLKMF